jgi:hypothetical protein
MFIEQRPEKCHGRFAGLQQGERKGRSGGQDGSRGKIGRTLRRPGYKHQEMGQPNLSTERRELVVRWISTVGNYDYMAEAYSLGWNSGCRSFYLAKNR